MPRPRGTGSIYLQKGSAVWWVKYYRNGKPYRESTHTTNQKQAQHFLKQRMGEIATGISYNAGVVKYFFSTLLRPLREERHFALIEISAIPTKARS